MIAHRALRHNSLFRNNDFGHFLGNPSETKSTENDSLEQSDTKYYNRGSKREKVKYKYK